MNACIPKNAGLVRHADYTGTENKTCLTARSLTHLSKNVEDLAEKLTDYQRIVLFHSPKQRAVLTTSAFGEGFKRKNIEVVIQQMHILDVDQRELTKKAIESEVQFAEKEGVSSFYLFITHEPVIEFFFRQQDPSCEGVCVENCEIITAGFKLRGHV